MYSCNILVNTAFSPKKLAHSWKINFYTPINCEDHKIRNRWKKSKMRFLFKIHYLVTWLTITHVAGSIRISGAEEESTRISSIGDGIGVGDSSLLSDDMTTTRQLRSMSRKLNMMKGKMKDKMKSKMKGMMKSNSSTERSMKKKKKSILVCTEMPTDTPTNIPTGIPTSAPSVPRFTSAEIIATCQADPSLNCCNGQGKQTAKRCAALRLSH